MTTMALRAAAAATRLPPPPPKPTSSKPQFKQSLPSLKPASSTAISLLALFSTPGNCCQARALSFPKEDIVSSLTQVEDTVDQVEEVGSKVLNFSQSVLKVLIDGLEPTIESVLPVLQKAGEEAVKIASPVVSDASKQAKEALQNAGVDPSPVLSAAKALVDAAKQATEFVEVAKPIASATVESISSTDPSVIIVSAGALFVVYLIFPPVWSAISFNLRGYKGNLSPAQTLDLISTRNHFLIDVRSEKDKNKAGVPRLPSSAKNKLISIPLEELPNKIRGLVRNAKKVEAEMVALKISYLKRVNRGSTIIIMDSYSDTAKIVARALTSLGFKNCWIMADGFSGSRGWLQSRLGADSYNVSLAEVLSPSRVIPAAVGRFGTTSSRSLSATRKLLPGSIDD